MGTLFYADYDFDISLFKILAVKIVLDKLGLKI